MSARWRIAGASLVLSCIALGCGGESTGKVKGQITYKQEPVAAGMLNLHMKEKGTAAAAKISGGAFAFDSDLPAGTYVAFVSPSLAEPQDPTKPKAPAAPPAKLPKKAMDMATSGLKVEVKPGQNDVKLELID